MNSLRSSPLRGSTLNAQHGTAILVPEVEKRLCVAWGDLGILQPLVEHDESVSLHPEYEPVPYRWIALGLSDRTPGRKPTRGRRTEGHRRSRLPFRSARCRGPSSKASLLPCLPAGSAWEGPWGPLAGPTWLQRSWTCRTRSARSGHSGVPVETPRHQARTRENPSRQWPSQEVSVDRPSGRPSVSNGNRSEKRDRAAWSRGTMASSRKRSKRGRAAPCDSRPFSDRHPAMIGIPGNQPGA